MGHFHHVGSRQWTELAFTLLIQLFQGFESCLERLISIRNQMLPRKLTLLAPTGWSQLRLESEASANRYKNSYFMVSQITSSGSVQLLIEQSKNSV